MAVATAAVFARGAASADTSLSGLFYSRANADLQQNSRFEDNREWRNKVFLELKADTSDNTQAVFSLLGEHATLAGSDTSLVYGVALHEGYLRLRSDRFDFYLGKQTVDWSKADVSVVDTINPRNFEEFAAREEEFVKIPSLMLRAVYSGDEHTFEALYVPVYHPSQFNLYGSDWAMLNNDALGDYQGEIDLGLYTKQNLKPGLDDYPEQNFINGTIGGRWGYRGEEFDYQVSYVNGWELLPLFEFNQDFASYLAAQPEGARKTLQTLTPQEFAAFSPLYRSRPIRQNQLGFGTSGYLGDSTVRAEVTVVHPQELYTNDFRLSEHSISAATFGIDRFLPANLYLNVSYLGAHVGQYPSGGLYLVREWNHFGVAVLRGTYFGDRFAPELRSMANILRGDYMLNPRLPYKLADNTTLSVGAYYMQGKQDSIFGQFRQNNFAYVQLRQSF
jgi:hypothetical protein